MRSEVRSTIFAAFGETDYGVAVFAVGRRAHLAAELVGKELHAIADGEDGEAGLEDVRRRLRRALVIHGGGPAGDDEAARVEALDLLPGGVVRDELAVDVALADAARDEHRVLGAEVDDDDGLALRALRGRWRMDDGR